MMGYAQMSTIQIMHIFFTHLNPQSALTYISYPKAKFSISERVHLTLTKTAAQSKANWH